MWRKSRDDRLARQLDDGAGELDAGRPAADDDEGEQLAAQLRVLADLGLLEGRQDAGADLGGVADRLQAGRRLLPFVMAEIGVPGAGGDDQIVVGDAAACR